MPRACHGLLSSFPAFSASEFRSDPFQTVERDLKRPFRKILSFSRSFFSLHNSSFEILFRVDLFHISSGLARKRRLRQGNLVKIPGEKKGPRSLENHYTDLKGNSNEWDMHF